MAFTPIPVVSNVPPKPAIPKPQSPHTDLEILLSKNGGIASANEYTVVVSDCG